MSRTARISSICQPGPPALSLLLLAVLALLPSAASPDSVTQAPPELDVPFVPTPHEVVERMLEMANVGSTDFVIDLGSGDGRIAVAAVRDRGASGALGVDIDPERVQEARERARRAAVADRVTFEVQDLFETDFSRATVVTMYLLPEVNLRLRPKVLDMAPGTRVVSHAFSMDQWAPDERADVDGRNVYMWVVPAKVGGLWEFTGPDLDFTMGLKQEFQTVTGTAMGANEQLRAVTGTLRGNVIQLNVDDGGAVPQRYIGQVQGDTMVALPGYGVHGWHATRR